MALDGDILGIAPLADLPNFIIEVGGEKKSVKLSLEEMTEQALPAGLVPRVVRQVGSHPKKRWRWHLASAIGFDSLTEVIVHWKDRGWSDK